MPMYEYGCLECRHRFDQLRRFDQDDTELICPHCNSERIERRLSLFAAHTRSGSRTVVEAGPQPVSGGCCGGSCGCGSRN